MPSSTETTTLTSAVGDVVTYDRHDPAAPTAGPAVVFVAGAGPYRACDPGTTATARALADRGVTAFVHDRVGRGDSRVEGRVDLDRELAALAVLADLARGATGVPPVLVGHSSGCSVVLAAAARGTSTSGLVLWEGPLDPPEQHAEVAAWVAEVDRLVAAGRLEDAMWHYMKDMPAAFHELARADPRLAQNVAQAGAYVADGESLAWACSRPLAELTGDLRVPVLAVVGTRTFPGMPESARMVAEQVPGASSERLAGAMHSWDETAMAQRLVAFTRAPVDA